MKKLGIVLLALLTGLTGQYAGFRSRKCATGLFLVLTMVLCVFTTHTVLNAGFKFGDKCERPMQLVNEGKLVAEDIDALEMSVERCRYRTWHAVAVVNGAVNLFCLVLVACGIWLRRAIRLEEMQALFPAQPTGAVNGFVCIPSDENTAVAVDVNGKPDPLDV